MGDLKRNGILQFAAKGQEQVRAALKDMISDLEKTKKETDKHETSVAKVVGTLKTAALAYVSLHGAMKVLDWAKQGAQAMDVADAYRRLSAGAGVSADAYLDSMKKAAQGTIAANELMRKSNYARMLGLEADFGDILKIARATAAATGQSVEYMAESLVVGIGRQSKLWLDNLGIIVDAEAAYARMAKQLGKSADALTEVERKQAFTTAAMKAGLELVDRIGGGQLHSDPFARLAASSKDLADSFKEDLVPVISELAGGIAALLKAYNDYRAWQQKHRSALMPEGVSWDPQKGFVKAPPVTTGAGITGDSWGAVQAAVAGARSAAMGPSPDFLPGLSMAELASAAYDPQRQQHRAAQARALRLIAAEGAAQARVAGSGVPFAGAAPGAAAFGPQKELEVPPLVEPSDTENLLKHAEALGAVGRQMELVADIGLRLKDHATLAGEAMLFTKNSTDLLGDAFADLIAGNDMALQQGLKLIAMEAAARLKAIASQAAIEALWQTALGIGSLAFGNFPKAGMHFKAAGAAAATAAAAGIAAGGISRTFGGGAAGGYGGGSSAASSTASQAASSSSGGGQDTTVTRVSPTSISVVIINQGPVYYGSQTEATVEAIQQALDTGQVVTGKREVA